MIEREIAIGNSFFITSAMLSEHGRLGNPAGYRFRDDHPPSPERLRRDKQDATAACPDTKPNRHTLLFLPHRSRLMMYGNLRPPIQTDKFVSARRRESEPDWHITRAACATQSDPSRSRDRRLKLSILARLRLESLNGVAQFADPFVGLLLCGAVLEQRCHVKTGNLYLATSV